MQHRTTQAALMSLVLILALGAPVPAQPRRAAPPQPGAGGTVNLPYTVNDNTGTQWMLYQGGWMRQNGNMPLYSQAAMLLIDGNGVGSTTNMANRDAKTGEIIFDNLQSPNARLAITRRVLINNEAGYVRYIDVFRNTQPQELSVNVAYQTNFNFGVATSNTITDPKKKDRPLAWVAQMQAGRALLEIYGGRGAKSTPEVHFMPENNMVRASQQITIPAGKQIALVHVHGTAASQDAAEKFVTSLKESKFLADVPADLRKIIVNFGTGGGYIDGDRELLRGDLLDVVELRSGDLVKGTLKESTYKLDTFYGQIELPADRVVSLMNIGQFRPRQLVVTSEGEVFGGSLAKEMIDLELSSGQATQIPITHINRIGYRKRPGEPEEWAFDRPMLLLRTGERIGIAPPQRPIEILTRYGLLKLQPRTIAAINFQAEEHGVHQVYLTDGSTFAGLASAPTFEMTLTGATGQAVSFPTSALRRLQLHSKPIENDPDETPTLSLANQDVLVGALSGRMKLETTFDTLDLDAAEIKTLTRAPESAGLDVQVTLWDQTTVSGHLQQPQVTCALLSGIQVTVPIALVEQYSNPNPRPSASMTEQIKSIVAQLSAEDWRTREAAEGQLVSMGPSVAGVLREMLASQPPEAQQRIESVLKELGKSATPPPQPEAIEPDPMMIPPE